MVGKVRLDWRVEVVTTDKLQATLNAYEKDDYEIERFEHHAETYEGVTWIVVGWKPGSDEGHL